MKSHEIYQRLSPALNAEILTHILENDKPAYKATLVALANQRKLRPVFLERKPKTERHIWMHQAIGQKASDEIAQNLLQFWLLTSQNDLLRDFLDGLGIAHDGKGGVDELPPAPEKAALQAVIDPLLAKYPPENVVAYLHAFHGMDLTAWPVLTEVLAEDPRLQLPVTALAK